MLSLEIIRIMRVFTMYHGGDFSDCVLYLDSADDRYDETQTDRLIIGKFCSIASGVKFMMGGNQGHDYKNISTYPLDKILYANVKHTAIAYKKKGDTVIGNDVWIGLER